MRRVEASQKRHAAILEAAMGCFIARGFHQTGMRDIARAANVSLGNLYNHFADKAAMIAAIAALEGEEIAMFLAAQDTKAAPRPALVAFVRDYLTLAAAPETIALTTELATEALRNPVLGALFEANRAPLRQQLTAILKGGMAELSVDPKLDAPQAASLIIDMIENLPIRLQLQGRVVDAAETETLLDFVVRLVTPR